MLDASSILMKFTGNLYCCQYRDSFDALNPLLKYCPPAYPPHVLTQRLSALTPSISSTTVLATAAPLTLSRAACPPFVLPNCVAAPATAPHTRRIPRNL